MEANEYQDLALRTAGTHDMPIYGALGLGGEAGEVLDLTKKWKFHGHSYQPEKFKDELGDVAWYLAITAAAHGYSLGEVLEHNIEKLKKRYPDGFSSERSINRE